MRANIAEKEKAEEATQELVLGFKEEEEKRGLLSPVEQHWLQLLCSLEQVFIYFYSSTPSL